MTNEERMKAFESITNVVTIYRDSDVKGSSVWCRFAQGSQKLKSKWKFRAYKSIWLIGIIALISYLFI